MSTIFDNIFIENVSIRWLNRRVNAIKSARDFLVGWFQIQSESSKTYITVYDLCETASRYKFVGHMYRYFVFEDRSL